MSICRRWKSSAAVSEGCSLLTFDSSADGFEPPEVVYPEPGEQPRAVEPFAELSLAEFEASAHRDVERTTLKLIASAEPLQLGSLVRGGRDGPARSTRASSW